MEKLGFFFMGIVSGILFVFFTVPKEKDYIESYLNHPEKYEVIKMIQVTPEGDTLKPIYRVNILEDQ